VEARHAQLLERRLQEGSLILAPVNTGICVPDEEAARAYMNEDPTIASGIARGELRRFRPAFLRGRGR
jgi:hypothetical protein